MTDGLKSSYTVIARRPSGRRGNPELNGKESGLLRYARNDKLGEFSNKCKLSLLFFMHHQRLTKNVSPHEIVNVDQH